MRKETVTIQGIRMPIYSLNTLIIGSGAASLNAAVSLHDFGQEDIAIVTDCWGGGTSNNAGSDKQTYYKISLSGETPDSPLKMAEDLFKGGCMHGDIALCEAQHSAQAFFHLVQLGVPFPHDRFGGYSGYKTDHDPKGRGTSAGPLTSRLMFAALAKDAQRKGIPIFDQCEVIAILVKVKEGERQAIGAIALDKKRLEQDQNGFVLFNVLNVVLGTGGPAGMYQTSVYPESQTGSTGLALRIGAIGQNLTESQFGLASTKIRWNVSGSYQQVIPRYISADQHSRDEREFLSEIFPNLKTLASATFLKGYQWPFDSRKVNNYGSSLIDLLVFRETVKKKRRVFLDYRSNPSMAKTFESFSEKTLSKEAYDYLEKSDALQSTPFERLRHLNQPAIDFYRDHGIDISREMLEIAVCVQHNNGGLKGNIWWESNIKHLFPVGEVNGSHGVYRPGGSALNAGQVGGLRAVMYISQQYCNLPPDNDVFINASSSQIEGIHSLTKKILSQKSTKSSSIEFIRSQIQKRMTECGGIIRNSKAVKRAVNEAKALNSTITNRIRILSAKELPSAFKILDLCLTHWIYLEALSEYLEKGGKSHGSFLVLDLKGEKPCAELEDEWRFRLTDDDAFVSQRILEIGLKEGTSILKKWAHIRPIPRDKTWFEQVWKEFREGKIVR